MLGESNDGSVRRFRGKRSKSARPVGSGAFRGEAGGRVIPRAREMRILRGNTQSPWLSDVLTMRTAQRGLPDHGETRMRKLTSMDPFFKSTRMPGAVGLLWDRSESSRPGRSSTSPGVVESHGRGGVHPSRDGSTKACPPIERWCRECADLHLQSAEACEIRASWISLLGRIPR
jgi:hypothetical protein